MGTNQNSAPAEPYCCEYTDFIDMWLLENEYLAKIGLPPTSMFPATTRDKLHVLVFKTPNCSMRIS